MLKCLNCINWMTSLRVTLETSHQSCSRQFSSPILQLLPKVVSTQHNKNLGPFARNSTIIQVLLSLWCQIWLWFSRFLFSVGSAESKFYFSLNVWLQCGIAILPLQPWNWNSPWLTSQPQCTTSFPVFLDQFQSFEHKLNNHCPWSCAKQFSSYILHHCPE